MFRATRARIVFTEVTDPKKHKDYNIWHILDHIPENLALPGVVTGNHWVSTPDCIKARKVSDPIIDKFTYMTLYWMQEPMERTFKDFFDLSERMKQVGRRPDIPYARRHVRGTFLVVKGYVNPRVLVSPEALIFRPARGLYVTVADLTDPNSVDAADMLQWYDQVHIPDMLQCKGIAGAWTFSSDPTIDHPRYAATPNPIGRIIHVYYLDEDPLEVMADIAAHEPKWKTYSRLRDNSKTQKEIFAGPLRAVIPWQWDWFEKEA